MSIEDIIKLVDKIEKDDYIDCSNVVYDNDQYKKIVAGLKQNIELQNVNREFATKLEKVENDAAGSLLEIEKILKINSELSDAHINFISSTRDFIESTKLADRQDIRIGDYVFHQFENTGEVAYKYEPLKKPEPIALEITVIENDKNEVCPICGRELGQYPALSRKDNKTKICSNCGMLEALEAFNNSLKVVDKGE